MCIVFGVFVIFMTPGGREPELNLKMRKMLGEKQRLNR